MSLFNREPRKYTKKWLQNLSDEEWSAEREIVRQQFVHGDELAEYRLQKFDDEYERRKIEHYKHEPWTPPKHTEHGWYLSEKD